MLCRILAVVAAIVIGNAAFASEGAQLQRQQRFERGMMFVKAGRLDAGIAEFRHLLKEVPAPRIKLELARALYLAGEFRESKALFDEVYDDPDTPQAVKRNILPFIEGAELRILRVRYGVRGITDSNPSRVAEGGTIFFNGVPLEYRPPSPKKTAYGLEPWVSVEKRWESGILTKFNSSARLFEDPDLRALRINGAVAYEVPGIPGMFVQGSVYSDFNRKNSFTLPTFEAWKRFKLSEKAGLGIGGQIGYMFSENDDVSGAYYRPYISGDWTFARNATVFASASFEHQNAGNDYYTYIAPKLDMGVNFSVRGVDLTPQLMLTYTRFSEFDPFWGLNRSDLTLRPAIALSYEGLKWKNFQPEMNVFYERRNSNVNIYDYSQTGGFINIKKAL